MCRECPLRAEEERRAGAAPGPQCPGRRRPRWELPSVRAGPARTPRTDTRLRQRARRAEERANLCAGEIPVAQIALSTRPVGARTPRRKPCAAPSLPAPSGLLNINGPGSGNRQRIPRAAEKNRTARERFDPPSTAVRVAMQDSFAELLARLQVHCSRTTLLSHPDGKAFTFAGKRFGGRGKGFGVGRFVDCAHG